MSGPPIPDLRPAETGAPPGSPYRCPNCGTPVEDRYCPHCGQGRAAHLLSLRRMAAEFADEQLALNGTLPRTLGALFFRPGHLTREYFQGRIVRYIRPFRLFLVSSLLFFVALSSIADVEAITRAGGAEDEAGPRAQQVEGESGPRWDNISLRIDSAAAPRWTRPLLRRAAEQEERLNSMPPQAAMGAMLEALLRAGARMSLLLVPGFAALLLALHMGRRPRYVEHFVFALHFHAFAFLLMVPLLLFGNGWLWGAAALWLPLYLLVALKKAYAQPWWMAVLKSWVVGVVYPIALSVAVAAASLLAILLA